VGSGMIEEYFTKTYEEFKWHMGSGESRSGIGSSLAYTHNIRTELPRVIKQYQIDSTFDCSCGDWNWMKHISDSFVRYVGNDVVKTLVESNSSRYSNERISFMSTDMLSAMKQFKDKEFDLILCRHTLEHLPIDYIKECLLEMKRISKYVMVTNTDLHKTTEDQSEADKRFVLDGVSYRPINLEVGFYFTILGNPIERMKEFSDGGKTCYANLYSV
jgi:hypothetical protein